MPGPRFYVGLVVAWATGRAVGFLLHSRNLSH